MVYSPGGRAFVIDVKGQYERNWRIVRERPERIDAFHALALAPDADPNRLYVLTRAE